MKKLYEENEMSIYEYNPSMFKPFYINLEPLSFRRRVRLFLAYFSGFKVYYLKYKDNYVGYCLVQSGKDRRYKFADEKDIMVGPYFIHENYRGQKLSIVLLDFVLNKVKLDFRYAYDYIHKSNVPSIKASKAVGFKFFSDANVSKILRRIELCASGHGEYIILKFINHGKTNERNLV